MIPNFPDVRQLDHYSCGAAAAMACGLFRGVGPKTLPAWKALLGTDVEESTRPTAIVETFGSLGLVVEASQKMTLYDLEEYVEEKGWPVICPVQDYGPYVPKKARFAYGHYLAVIGIYEGFVICQDSSEDNVIASSGSAQDPGKVMISLATWGKIWHDKDVDGNKYVRYGIAIGPREGSE